MKRVDSVLELVGKTPLVKINGLSPNPDVDIYAKLEKFNPMGSIKDRIALYMIEESEKKGEITEDTVIVEATSGNTGLGLAMVCAIKGYHLHLTMSRSVSVERMRMLNALGAELELTPADEGTDGAIRKAEKLSKKEGYWRPNQFDNPVNTMTHYRTTGKEIYEALQAEITHFAAGMGTTGTLMGVSKFLKKKDPSIKIIGIEPTKDYNIQGLKNMTEDRVPEIYEPERLDEIRTIHDDDAFKTARKLALREGLFVGMSSGAAMYVSMELAKEIEEGTIVTIFPDGGEKYFSTSLFDVTECLRCIKEHSGGLEHPPEDLSEYDEELNKLLREKEKF
ncbi:MAG: cysteine synthase family protein [Candidatus Saliniplasma sp.]